MRTPTMIAGSLLLLLSAATADNSHLLYARQDPSSPTCTVAAAQPVPSSAICSVGGLVRKPAVLSTFSQSKLQTCRDQCYFNASCRAFSFKQSQRQCILYSKPLAAQQFEKKATGTKFWSKNCFTCSCNDATYSLKCGTTCVDPSSRDNCQKCGNKCATGQFCDPSDLGCFCPYYSKTLCPSGCADLPSDSSNCGACGNQCPDGQECNDGACQDIPKDKCFTLTASNQALIQDNTTICAVNGQPVYWQPITQGANTMAYGYFSRFVTTPQVFCLSRNSGYLYLQNTTDTGVGRADTAANQQITEIDLGDPRKLYCFLSGTDGGLRCLTRDADDNYLTGVWYACCSIIRLYSPESGEVPSPRCYEVPDPKQKLNPVSFSLKATLVN